MKNIILISILITLIACSENTDESAPPPENDHIWKTQTDALQQTKDLADKLNEEFKKKQQQMQDAQQE
ncbi:MAG: hypothetical protein ACC657_08200 [Thiohalomonadales bacterium]